MIDGKTILAIPALIFGIIFGGILIGAVWNAGDQVVGMTDNKQLQSSYESGKQIIDTASEAEDMWGFATGISALSLIIGVPAYAIKKILES